MTEARDTVQFITVCCARACWYVCVCMCVRVLRIMWGRYVIVGTPFWGARSLQCNINKFTVNSLKFKVRKKRLNMCVVVVVKLNSELMQRPLKCTLWGLIFIVNTLYV